MLFHRFVTALTTNNKSKHSKPEFINSCNMYILVISSISSVCYTCYFIAQPSWQNKPFSNVSSNFMQKLEIMGYTKHTLRRSLV